jgi:ABC-type Fe3+-hydroxamate transport system substrate-binding protein
MRRASIGLLVAVLGCKAGAPRPAAATIVDDAGDPVTVEVPVRRIASLIPATTEILFAIGAGDRVVGRTAWCDYPAEARRVDNLGDGINPSLEAILARRPDLVLLYNSSQHAAAAKRLRDLGIPTLRVSTDALSDVARLAKLFGRLTGREREADSVSVAFDTALASASTHVAGRRPKVLLLVWEQPPMTIGRGSFLNDLVERAGGENLFADVAATAGNVSIEAVAVRDPDLILTTTAGPAAFATRPEWQVVWAVRERRFLHVTGSEFDRPSPRSPRAIRQLAGRLRELSP